MIRFQPDTLGHALTRFFDMAAPDNNVYVEIAAPDVRFAAIVLLALAAVLVWRRLGSARRPTFAMLGVLFVSAAIWLATTGNGRYFMAMLVCAGPIAMALVCLLPITRSFKACLALLLVSAQAFVLWQQPPWDSWSLGRWTHGPYFEVRLGPQEETRPVTYATLSILTYSLIAPQFPAESRWISLYAEPITPADARREEAFLRRALAEGPVKVLAPVIPEASLPDGLPNAEMAKALGTLLAPRKLRVSGSCGFISAPGMAQIATRRDAAPADAGKFGFWSCPVAYDAAAPAAIARVAPPEPVEQAFAKLGEMCPRFFPAGRIPTLRVADGWLRHFESDTRVYVLDNGEVWYKFWRSLNPVRVGTVPALLSGEATIDCLQVRGADGAWHSGRQ